MTGKLGSLSESDVRSTSPRERHLDLVRRARCFDFLPERLGSTMAQASLAYCLSHAAVATAIPGAMTEVELAEDVNAAGFAPLSAELAGEVTRRQLELGPAA